jgi:methylated-DNA-[protein]-cysteine S-methyltransferase
MRYGLIRTRLGRLLIVADARALKRVRFAGSPQFSRPDRSWQQGGPLVDEAVRQLRAYFDGKLRVFDLPAAPEGTSFERQLWTQLRRIPCGTTVSYGQLARRIGRPTAPRAVGAACGKNPVAIIIPCHRVVGADGGLTGYAAGLDRKRKLLALERSHLR